jgi:hypothetical protein
VRGILRIILIIHRGQSLTAGVAGSATTHDW